MNSKQNQFEKIAANWNWQKPTISNQLEFNQIKWVSPVFLSCSLLDSWCCWLLVLLPFPMLLQFSDNNSFWNSLAKNLRKFSRVPTMTTTTRKEMASSFSWSWIFLALIKKRINENFKVFFCNFLLNFNLCRVAIKNEKCSHEFGQQTRQPPTNWLLPHQHQAATTTATIIVKLSIQQWAKFNCVFVTNTSNHHQHQQATLLPMRFYATIFLRFFHATATKINVNIKTAMFDFELYKPKQIRLKLHLTFVYDLLLFLLVGTRAARTKL